MELHIACIERTASALLESEGATPEDIETAIQQCEQALDQGKRFELLELIARVQGHDEEFMSEAVYKLSECVSHTLQNPPILINFAAKLIAPNAFYSAFPDLFKDCSELLCPVIFAEDTDAIGTASINPIAAMMMAERIGISVKERTGIRPFMTSARLDYESWCFITRKHFET
ncbi:MAG: hypothetical protein ACNA8L_08105 [Luteolibacter sp.]